MLGGLHLVDEWLDDFILNLDELIKGLFRALLLLLDPRLVLDFGLFGVFFKLIYLSSGFQALLHHILRIDTILIRLDVPLHDCQLFIQLFHLSLKHFILPAEERLFVLHLNQRKNENLEGNLIMGIK